MKRTLWLACLFAGTAALSSSASLAQTLPSDNRDLTVVLARDMNELEHWIELTGSRRWVRFNPEPLEEVHTQLGRVVQGLHGTIYYLKIAAIDVDRHYSNLLDEYTRKERNLAGIKEALELQQKYLSIANAALDLTNLVDWYRSSMADPRLAELLGERTPTIMRFEELNQLDIAVQGVLAAYSRLDTAKDLASNGEIRWGKLKKWDDELKDCGVEITGVISLASDSKNIATAFGEANLLQREMLAGRVPMDTKRVAELRRVGAGALAQLVGKIGIEVAKLQRRNLLERAKELDEVIGAEGKALQASGIEKAKIYDRWMAAEAALKRAQRVRSKLLALRYRLVEKTSNSPVPPVDLNLSWGDGLRGYKVQFETMAKSALQSAAAVNAVDSPPGTMTILTPTVKINEAIIVDFTAPVEYSRTAWIGIVPSDTPHGSEMAADKVDLSYSQIAKRTSGRIKLPGISKPGRYDVRFFDDDSLGFEIASFTVTVLDKQ